jgi:hypothetical protein
MRAGESGSRLIMQRRSSRRRWVLYLPEFWRMRAYTNALKRAEKLLAVS